VHFYVVLDWHVPLLCAAKVLFFLYAVHIEKLLFRTILAEVVCSGGNLFVQHFYFLRKMCASEPGKIFFDMC